MQWPLVEGSQFIFPSVLEGGGEKGEVELTPAQMTTDLQADLRAANMEDKAVHDAGVPGGRGGEP